MSALRSFVFAFAFLALPAAAQEHAAPAAAEKVDFILPHITDGLHLEVPYWAPPFAREVCLGRHVGEHGCEPLWGDVHLGPVTLNLSPTKHVVFLFIGALVVSFMLIGAARAHARHTHAIGRPRGFALAANSADSVIFTTLPPGPYTAQVSAASGAAGVALIEVYDLSAAAAGQKLFNISTRANAGSGDATLIAGISVSGVAPKRVLIRAIGPGLAQFGLTGVLAAPQLQIIKDGVVVAQNTGLATSPDAAAIATVSAQVGAFALPANSADCALLVNLAPGNYSAVVSGVGGTSGIAIVEVYEVP